MLLTYVAQAIQTFSQFIYMAFPIGYAWFSFQDFNNLVVNSQKCLT